MAATVQAQIANGSGPTTGSAEGGVTYGRDDLVISAATIPVPTTTGTHFSWPKALFLNVTATGGTTTHLSNRTIALVSAIATGIHRWWKANTGAYAQATTNADVDSASNGATPTGYTEVTTTPSQYDNTSVQNNTGKNGAYALSAIGIDNLYVGGGGTSTLPGVYLAYDEGP